ncbi:hypothetical protein JCM1840_005911 [Sporobolomyces johnsonii]
MTSSTFSHSAIPPVPPLPPSTSFPSPLASSSTLSSARPDPLSLPFTPPSTVSTSQTLPTSPTKLPRRARSGTMAVRRPPMGAMEQLTRRRLGPGVDQEEFGNVVGASTSSNSAPDSSASAQSEASFVEGGGERTPTADGMRTTHATEPLAADDHEQGRRAEEEYRDAIQALALRQLDRERSLSRASQPGVFGRRVKKWLVLVVPPDVLPHSPPPAPTSGFASGYGPSGRYSDGILLPLQPTLSAQVSLIAREFSLPSIAGICVYLCLPSDQSTPVPWATSPDSSRYSFSSAAERRGGQELTAATKPRLTDDTWSILWAGYLDDDGQAEGILGVGGLPIAGRLEFDIDPRRARWLPAWCALPAATPNTYPAIRPRSPAFEYPAGQRPRFGTSLSYARPFTPASSDAYTGEVRSVTESQEGDEDDDGPTAEDETVHYPAPRLHPPASPHMSTPRSGFHSPRRLSLLSQGSSIFRDPPSPGAMSDLRLPTPTSSRPPSRSRLVPHPRSDESPSEVKPTFSDDSGFAESVSFAIASRPGETDTPVKKTRSTGVSGSTFAFPRPEPRDFSVKSMSEVAGPRAPGGPAGGPAGEADTTMEWTVQLDHLREFSETSLMESVVVADAEGAGSSALGELLSLTQEEGADETVKVDHDLHFHSSIYPPAGLYSPSPVPRSASPRPAHANVAPLSPSTQLAPRGPSNLAAHPHLHLSDFIGPKSVPLVDISPRIAHDLSPTFPSQYPFLQIYPPVYPSLTLYPSIPPGTATSTPKACNNKPSALPISGRDPSVHAIPDPRSTIPSSPYRLPSPSPMERLTHSAEFGDFKAKQFGELEVDDEAEKARAREGTYERKSSPVGGDWKTIATGTRSSRDASELSPALEDEQEDDEAGDDYDEERSSFDDDSDSEDDNDEIYAAYQGTALSSIAEETESQGLTTHHGTPSSGSVFGIIEEGNIGDEKEHTIEHEERELSGGVAVEEQLARSTATVGSGEVADEEQLHVDAEAPASPFALLPLPDTDRRSSSQPNEESLQIPSVDFAPAPDMPMITYSSATASPSPSSHYSSPPTTERITSPLPSPTITPSSAISAARTPSEPIEEVTSEPVQAEAIDEYTFELDTTGTAHEDESGEIPYIASPGLQRALGLDDSPEIHPVSFPVDDSESDDSQSDDGSQYVVRGASGTGADFDGDQVVEMEDEECQTFDHLSPLPLPAVAPPPVLFSFSNANNLQEIADAMNTFVIEAQTQSIERRGKFTIALSGGELPELLAQALVADERVEWDKWDIFFTDESLVPLDHPDSTCKAYADHLFSKTPIPSSRIHVINAAELAGPGPVSTQVAESIAVDYEGQLLQAFPDLEGPGLAPGPPRFDMVLLGIGADGHTASLFPSHPALAETKWWVSPVLDAPTPTATASTVTAPRTSPRITLTYPVLSSARRLAFLCVGATKRAALANVLDVDVARDGDEKVPAGRIALAGHPVVVFADDEAVEGLGYPTTRFWDEG